MDKMYASYLNTQASRPPEKLKTLQEEVQAAQSPPPKSALELEEKRFQDFELLEELKLQTMSEMVEEKEYFEGDAKYTTKRLFLTNSQADKIRGAQMHKAIETLNLRNPKLVIRLMPSWNCPASVKGEPRYTLGTLNPYCTESEQESTRTAMEAQLARLMLDKLLPLAQKEQALIVGALQCGLMLTFCEVAKQFMRGTNSDCPFTVLLYGDAGNLLIDYEDQRSVAWQLLEDTKWDTDSHKEATAKRFGEDPGFWPHTDLPAGPSHFVIFESLAHQEQQWSTQPGQRFMNELVSSMGQNVPVIALQAFGLDCGMWRLTSLSEHVSNQLPLLLLDCRKRAKAAKEEAHAKSKKRLARLNSRACGDSVSLDEESPTEALDQIMTQLRTTQEVLRSEGKVDLYHCSNLAYIKGSLLGELAQRHLGMTSQCDLWLWEAIEDYNPRWLDDQPAPNRIFHDVTKREAKRFSFLGRLRRYLGKLPVEPEEALAPASNKHGKSKAKHPSELEDEPADPELLASECATRFIELVGDDLDYLRKTAEEDALQALQEVLAATSWADFRTLWDASYSKIRNYSFWDYKNEKLREATNDWLELVGKEKGNAQGRTVIKIRALDIGDSQGEAEKLKEAKDKLREILEDEFGKYRHSLASWFSKATLKENQRQWLALYTLLKSRNVHASNLFDLSGCEKELRLMANVDRLPEENSFEALILLRCAWTLFDTFTVGAHFWKLLSKITYLALILASLAVVTLISIQAREPYLILQDVIRFTLLGLTLFEGFLSAWIVFLDPVRKWTKLKGGSLVLQSEIWKFRTRTGPYRDKNGATQRIRVQAERRAEMHLRTMLEATSDTILQGAGLKQTSFYSRVLVSCDLSPTGINILPAGLQQSQSQHMQYRLGPARELGPDEDNYHSPAGPEEYLNWRLMPAIAFYRGRIPKLVAQRFFIQLVVVSSSVAGAVLAAINSPQWIAILSCAANTLLSWQEFTSINKKLDRYSFVVASLNRFVIQWQTKSEMEQQDMREIETLVERCECVITSEHAAWISEAQLSAKLLEEAGGDQPGRMAPKNA